MTAPAHGQNDHKANEIGFSRYEKWQDIPVEVLRAFADELRFRYTDRGLAKMVSLSATAAQDFVKGRTQPERRTLRAFGELYLKLVPLTFAGVVRNEERSLPPLKSVLPEGEEAALAYIEQVFRAAEEGGGVPASAEQLREWLEFLVQAEYQLEAPYEEHRRKRKAKGSGGAYPPPDEKAEPE